MQNVPNITIALIFFIVASREKKSNILKRVFQQIWVTLRILLWSNAKFFFPLNVECHKMIYLQFFFSLFDNMIIFCSFISSHTTKQESVCKTRTGYLCRADATGKMWTEKNADNKKNKNL